MSAVGERWGRAGSGATLARLAHFDHLACLFGEVRHNGARLKNGKITLCAINDGWNATVGIACQEPGLLLLALRCATLSSNQGAWGATSGGGSGGTTATLRQCLLEASDALVRAVTALQHAAVDRVASH